MISNTSIDSSLSYVGGGINIISYLKPSNLIINLNNLTLLNNYANIGGGYFIQGIELIDNPDVKMKNNKALLYGQDGFLYPTYIKLILTEDLTDFTYDEEK